jgi:hypothetical protein
VDGSDLTVWKNAFGVNANGDADGDGDSDGADFLAWQRTLGSSGALGAINGNFSSVSIVDPNGFMPAGLTFQIVKTATAVQLHVVATGGMAAAPEPSTFGMAIIVAAAGLARRRHSWPSVPRGDYSPRRIE